jgi:DNA-binding transcriptional LysR family regulator
MAANWRWDDVRFFLAAAREGSLSGAAKAVGVDHVTVGRRIAALEEQLRTKLLSRTPDGLAPTSAGQTILKQCEIMEGAALALERMVAGHDTRTAGSVRVTATDVLSRRILMPVVVALRKSHPELQIDLLIGVRSLDIARREADLAVRVSNVRPADSQLVCRKLGEIGFTLYASRQYLERHGTPARGQGLANHDLISFPGTPRLVRPFFMGESLQGARYAVRSNDQYAQLTAAAQDLGICELACFFGDSYPEVVRVWAEETPNFRPVWLITHQDLRRAARIRVVSVAIAAAFERKAKTLRYGQPRLTRSSE